MLRFLPLLTGAAPLPADRKICASLFLQQLLYYQFFFGWAWIWFWFVWLVSQVSRRGNPTPRAQRARHAQHGLPHGAYVDACSQPAPPPRRARATAPRAQYWQGLYFKDDDVVRIVAFTFWLLAEPIRLAAGWYGNLQENVSWGSGKGGWGVGSEGWGAERGALWVGGA